MSDINIVNGTFRSEITVKKSRFICSIKGNVNKDEAEEFVSKIKKEFPDARHNCYAYIIDDNTFRYSDDGEPQGTAGMPIYEVLKNKGIKQSVCVVTRYFGGILLGASGLLTAYKDAAIEGLRVSDIAQKVLRLFYTVTCSYPDNALVENMAQKYGYVKVESKYEDLVTSTFTISKEETESFVQNITECTKGKADINKQSEGYVIIPSKEI